MLRRAPLVPCVVALFVGALSVGPTAQAADVVSQPPSTPRSLAFASDPDGDGQPDIVLVDLESRARTVVLPADANEDYVTDGPELSPDGSTIAVSTDRGSLLGVAGIAVVPSSGGGLRRLTEPPRAADGLLQIDVDPRWSPDGASILFTRLAVDADTGDTFSGGVWTVPAAGGGAAQVPVGDGAIDGDWSPDGQQLVFVSTDPDQALDDGTGTLYVSALDGTGRRALPTFGASPAWSPDGSLIAYTAVFPDDDKARGQDTSAIEVTPAAGGDNQFVLGLYPQRAWADEARWAPDGQSLACELAVYDSAGNLGPSDIWLGDLAGDRVSFDRTGARAGAFAKTPGDEYQPSMSGPSPTQVTAGPASRYVAVSPQRLLDTRDGTGRGGNAGQVGAGEDVLLPIRGVQLGGQVVPDDVTAVTLNVTATGGTASTDIRAYPSGQATPTVSNLNVGPHATVANLVTVAVGSDGAIRLRNNSGQVDLLADIAGYYVSGGGGVGFGPAQPARLLDTRTGVGAPHRRVGPGGRIALAVTGHLDTQEGSTDVPLDATAVVLNVTAVAPSAATDVRVYPDDGSPVPTVSNVNVAAGQTAPNLVVVKVGPDGKVVLRNNSGTVDLVADLAGWYSPESTGLFVPVTPTRFLDTRVGIGAAAIPTGAGESVDLGIAGMRGVAAGAVAAVLNVTGTGGTAATDIRLYPRQPVPPKVSNLNLAKSATRANLVMVKLTDQGRVLVRNNAGSVHLIADLAGYFVNG